MRPRLSILVSARKDSKYLAKFLFGYLQNTEQRGAYEILVMLNKNDTWNKELVEYFSEHEFIDFYYEDKGLGRGGLHEYYNELYEHSRGEWIIYFCEDHFINVKGWDKYVLQVIDGGSRSIKVETENAVGALDYKKPWCIIPKFDNCGAMNHILSRGYIDAIGGMGKHGWIDSYLNDLNKEVFGIQAHRPNNHPDDIVIKLDDETFHDFTHDKPNPMDESNHFTPLSERGKRQVAYDTPGVKKLILKDAEKLRSALK